MSRKIALIIGNSEYEDGDLASLVAPNTDVRALAEVLRDPEIGGFEEVETLVNQPATIIRRTVSRFFAARERGDLLLLYFSGHGIRDDRGQLFLAVKDTDHTLLRGTAIPAGFITEEMDNSRSRRQILILDCCQSGAFSQGMKGAPVTSVGTAATFEGTGSGRVVLTATDSTQYAWEGDRLVGQAENSVFTHFLIQGLRTGEADTDADGRITLDELYEYVYEQVVNETPKQTPGKWTYRQQGELVIAKNPRPVIKPAELSPELLETINDSRPWVRQGAIHELERLLQTGHPGLALVAQQMLEELADDDSRRVASAAAGVLAAYRQTLPPTEAKQVEESPLAAREELSVQIRGPEPHEQELKEVDRTAEEEIASSFPENPEQEQFASIETSEEYLESVGLPPEEDHLVQVGNALADAGSRAGDGGLPERAAGSEPSNIWFTFLKLVQALPRWTVWAGLLLVSIGIVALIASLWPAPGMLVSLKIMQTASITPPAAATISAIEPSSQPTNPSPVVLVATNAPQPTKPTLAVLPLTNTPPPTAELTRTTPPLPSNSGRIAFVSNRDGNDEIYVMNADGSGLTRLTDNPADDRDPAWSYDGTQILFSSDRSGKFRIYVMNADGSGQAPFENYWVDHSGDDTSPTWSPDGVHIAYESTRDGNHEIFGYYKKDNYLAGWITRNSWDDYDPAWSPDGTRLAFTSTRSGNLDIFLVDPTINFGDKTKITGPLMFDQSPAWSPDSTRIAYTSSRGGQDDWEIYVVNADGTQATQLTDNLTDEYTPAWSPDGTRIAFSSERNYNNDIFVMNADGSGEIQLTNDPAYDWGPAWQW